MIIGIEAQRLFRRKKHGMEVVALEIIRQLQQIDQNNQFILFAKDDEDKNCISPTQNFSIATIPSKPYPIWEQLSLPKFAKKNNVDILHCTANTAPLFYKRPLIITIHDVIYLESFDFSGSPYQNFGNLYRRFIVPRVAKKAAKIITVSEYAKTIIVARLKLPSDKVDVVHNGVNSMFRHITDEAEKNAFRIKYNLPEKFLLHFGNTAPRKNTIGVLKAHQLYTTSVSDPLPLVITSCTADHINGLLKEINATELMKHIHIVDYLSSAELPYLYNVAEVFLYPSLNEGFGMPVIEAMACGTPVITSTTSSLPEVAGNAACLVDPQKPDEIFNAIQRLLTDNDFYISKQRDGFKNALRFSWKNAAEKTLSIYKALNKK